MSCPKVMVLILSYNGKQLLEESISSYMACNYPDFQVAVIDNGSTDGTEAYVKLNYNNVRLLRTEKNLGYSEGMNFGLRYAFEQNSYEYALLSNNDVRVDPNIITTLVEAAKNYEKVAFVTGKIYYYDRPSTLQSIGRTWHPGMLKSISLGKNAVDNGQFEFDRQVDFCDDVFWLVNSEIYNKIGGYDPQFFLQCEDFDWQLRARNAGYKIIYAHKAMLWHKVSATIGKRSPQKAYYDARNSLVVIMKNLPSHYARPYVKNKVFSELIPTLLKQGLKGRVLISTAMLRGILSAFFWKLKHGTRFMNAGKSTIISDNPDLAKP